MNLNEIATQHLQELSTQHLRRALRSTTSQFKVDFSSNDYLGLSQNQAVIEAGVRMAQAHGAGATGSRLLSGNLPCFEPLEARIAAFKRMPAALLFATGYQANATTLASLLDKQLWGSAPLLLTDRLNHASLHHACQLAGIKQHRFRHNDLAHLAELLNTHAKPGQPIVIATETVFGMEGDQLDVVQLAEIALQYGALVYLDEAHATGVWGPEGRGLGSTAHPAIDALKSQGLWVVMGTFSKAVGVSGGYVACSNTLRDWLLNRCSGFIYSTAPSPFVVGAVSKALELIPAMKAEREALHARAQSLRQSIEAAGFETGTSNSHIVPIIVEKSALALELNQYLSSLGILASAVRPPTVAPNTARVRLALCSFHNDSHITPLLSAIGHWKST